MDWRLTTRRPAQGSARGEAVTEFALLAPILLLVLFGIFEVGRVVDAWIIVHNAAREGARVGAVSYAGPASTAATTAANAAAAAARDYLLAAVASRGDIVASTVTANADPLPGEVVSVTASVQVEVYTPIMQSLLKNVNLPVSAKATLRRQW